MNIFKRSFSFLSKVKANNVAYKFHSCSLSFVRQKSLIILQPNVSYIYTIPRYFSNLTLVKTLSSKKGKIFQEVENEYAHGILEKSADYSRSIMKSPLEIDHILESVGNFSIFDKFAEVTAVNISEKETLENEKFSNLVKDICGLLPQATDDEVQRTLHCLCLWPPTASTWTLNFKALWNTLDKECVKRMKRWDVSHKLLIADYWFHLRLSRISQYNRELVWILLENCELLSNQQVVQLMFYVNLQRKLPDIFLPNLEKKLESTCVSVSIEELGIICVAFFKTESKISNANLIQSIIKQLMGNLESINNVTFAAILKFLRKSLNNSLIDSYITVMHKCIPCVKNWDVLSAVHLVLLSSECNVYHPLLLNTVSDKLADEIVKCRLKDCTKFLQCLAHFNHFPTKKFQEIIFAEYQKAERQNEVNLYPRDIVYLSLYYAYMGHFNYEVLANIFKKQFTELACSAYSDLIHAFVEIDYCIEIECEDYFGPRMDTLPRNVLERRRGNLPSKSSNQNMQTRLLASVHDCLTEILGNGDNILIRHILPHIYSPDIIVRLHTVCKKSLKEVSSSVPPDVVLVPPKNEIWACFVVCGIYSFAFRSKQISGITAMKLRQLKKLGYCVIFVPYFDLPQNPTVRKNFLRQQLKALEEKYANHQTC